LRDFAPVPPGAGAAVCVSVGVFIVNSLSPAGVLAGIGGGAKQTVPF
jgi:hypothetical protein